MKKIILSIFSLLAINTISIAQCSTTFVTTQNCSYDPINTFTMGGVASVGNNNAYGSCNVSGDYIFATPVRTLAIGATIPWAAMVGHGVYNDGIAIWIDLNNNNIYEASEMVASSAPALTHSSSFVMPTGVTGTPLRMRLRTAYNAVHTATQACVSGVAGGYGETENYFVVLTGGSCPTPTISLTAQTNIACNGGATGSATISAAGGAPFTYTWSPSGGNLASASGLSAGTYSCAVTNSCGATATQTVTISQPTAISITPASQTNISCNGGSNGAASVNAATGGAGGFTYNWTPGNPTGDGTTSITGLTAGSWICTVTDANSCTRTQTFNITQPSALATATAVTNILCNGGSTGSASVTASGGTAGYTYLWSNGATTSTITGLMAGAYTSTVTDSNGCTSVKNVTITQPSALSTATAVTNILCNGGSTGSATVTVSGGTAGYTYLWSNGATTSTITGLMAGAYTSTVTDSNGCNSVKNVTITQPSALATATAVTNILCNGGSTGSASVTASGGTAGYTYLWSNGATTSTVSSLMAGAYTSTVTDANGCITTTSVSITEPTTLSLTVVANNSVICTGNSSTLTANGTGGTGAITYTWVAGPASSLNVVSPTTNATYTVNIMDANGCSKTETVSVVVNALPILTAVSDNTLLCVGETANLTASGATSYTWNTTATTSVIAVSPTVTTTYTVNGTDVNGCSNTTTLTQNVSLCTGMETLISSSNGVFVYPNPSNGLFTLESSSISNLIITDVLGKVILTQNLETGKNTVDLSNYSNGVYMLSVSHNGLINKTKIIKQ
jgi:uncharacterized protein affecting Mg2+/Co2+ transport